MEINTYLQKLKDIHEPTEVIGILPLAPIWYLIIALSIIATFLIYLRVKKPTRVIPLKTQALLYLDSIKLEANNACITKIAKLIRTSAVHKYKHNKVAALTGYAWLEFLDTNLEEKSFNTSIGELLLTANYQKDFSYNMDDLEKLRAIVKKWIEVNL